MLLNNFYCNDKAKQTLVNFITDGVCRIQSCLKERMDAENNLCQNDRGSCSVPAGKGKPSLRSVQKLPPDFVRAPTRMSRWCHRKIRQMRFILIRSVRSGSTAYIRPNDGEYKVYILRNIHNMTEQAQSTA